MGTVALSLTKDGNMALLSAHDVCALTFDLQEHELLVGHGAVVGHVL